MMVVPSAKDAATASTRYSSIIEGARSGGTSTPRSFEARTRKSRHRLAGVAADFAFLDRRRPSRAAS